MTETYKQYNGVTMRREEAGIEMKDILLHINPDCNDLIVGPQMERALRQYFAENPEPPKFVPKDGIYTTAGSLYSKVYKYREGAWRNSEGYVIVGRQNVLSEMAQSGELVRLVRETDDA